MDSDARFWISVWSLALGASSALLAAVVATNAVDNAAIEKQVNHGSEPLAAACAIRGHTLECVAAGVKK